MSTGLAYLFGPFACGTITVMTTDLEAAAAAYQRAKKTFEDRRAALGDAIVKAARDGTRQADIVRVTGYTRERVRQILRDAGVGGVGE